MFCTFGLKEYGRNSEVVVRRGSTVINFMNQKSVHTVNELINARVIHSMLGVHMGALHR